MSTALEAILKNPSKNLEVLVDIYSAKRSDGTLKTWTFSTHGRDLGNGESAYPFLLHGQIGPLAQSLSEDIQFGGLAQVAAGGVKLVQPWAEEDLLSQMLGYTFGGYKCQVRIGFQESTTYDSTNFPPLRTARIDGEPTYSHGSIGPELSFTLMSVLQRMMNEPLITKRYVGIPTCVRAFTGSGKATRAWNAVYDLPRYTIMGRFKLATIPSGTNVALFRKLVSGTNCHFLVRALQTTGYIEFFNTSGGGTGLSVITTTNSCDGQWHVFVASQDAARTAYLMIDGGEVFSATPGGSPDLAAAQLEFTSSVSVLPSWCDYRIYDRYMAPDEARTIAAVRAEGLDLGVVGMWRFDDNTGSVAGDESVNNLDATIGGTEGVDWEWAASYLGEAEQAGRPYPLVRGLPFNCLAQYIDTNRDLYRLHESQISAATLVLRSRGTVLSFVDYTDNGDGTLSTTAAEDQPVTFDLTGEDTTHFISNVARDWLVFNTGITPSTEEDSAQTTALQYLCPWTVGQFVDQDTKYADVLSQLFGPGTLHYREDIEGRMFPDFLLPPTGLGPRGTSMLDLRGKSGNYVDFGNVGNITSSMTLVCWVKTSLLDQTTFTIEDGDFAFMTKKSTVIVGITNYSLSLITSGVDAGRLRFYINNTADLKSSAGIIDFDTLYFVAAVFDDTANTMRLYCSPYGSPLIEVASASGITATPTTTAASFKVGRIGDNGFPWGAVTDVQVWSTTKTLVELQALMDASPVGNEANLAVYAPLTAGDLSELVGGGVGVINGTATWTPKLEVNLTETASVTLTDFRRLAPAWKIVVRYGRNWHPMTHADIDSGVDLTDRLGLSRQWRDVTLIDEDLTTYEGARELILDTCLVFREDAERLARFLKMRFGVTRYVAKLQFPSDLQISSEACGLEIGDEVYITSTAPEELAEGKVMRVTAITVNPLELSAGVVVWG